MADIRRRVVISGKVQGVFFRESTRKRAEALGVSGWIKNMSDGRVEALFEGSEEKVAAIVDYVRNGPEHATVEGVEIEEVTGAPEYRDFLVERSRR